MEEIKVGDVVWLGSGSPAMTVERFEETGGRPRVTCSWPGDDGTPQSETFPLVCLTKTPTPNEE